jgi:hypothetical protein
VANGDESLLDVFVNIKPDPGFMAAITASADAAINEYTRVFSSASIPAPRIAPPNVTGGGGGGGGTGGGSGGGGGGAGPIVNDLRAQLRQAILEFQRDKAFLEVDVRIANDKDLRGRLQDITNRVKANEAIANAPESDETQQADAIQRIIDLRLQNLNVLRQTANAQRTAAGLDTADFDRNLRFRQEGVAAGQSLLGVKTVGKTVTAAKDTGLTQEFETLTTALNQAKFNLKQGFGAQSLVDVTAARTDIERIAAQLNDLRTRAEAKIVVDVQVKADQAALKEQFDFASQSGKEEISKGRIEDRLESSLNRGLASGEIRQNIAKLRAELELAELEVRKFSGAFDGTQDSVDRVVTSVQNLKIAQLNLKEMHVNARTASGSMNTLSNNAYQLGQAFEDAAVGYSLNGLTGAFRGASNNINFLINDIVRLESVQDRLGKGLAAKVTVGAAVATAITTLVLPSLIEWLQSLNDIEVKFEDISDQIKQGFDDVKFNVEIQSGERDFLRSIERAKELRDILQKLGEVAEGSSDKAEDLQRLFSGLDENDTLSVTLNQLRVANELLDERKVLLEGQRDRNKAAAESGIPLTPESQDAQMFAKAQFEVAIKQLESLGPQLELVKNLYDQLRIAREKGLSGTSDSEQLSRTVKLFQDVKKSVEGTFSELDPSDKEASKKFKETILAFQSVIGELSKASEEIDSFEKKLNEGLTLSQKKIKEFSETQEVIRRTIAGTSNEQSIFTREVQRSAQEFQTLIEKIREANLALAPTEELRGLVNREADTAREALRIETETELLLRQKDVRDEIEKISDKKDKASGKASLTNFEQFAQTLQKNVLSLDPIDRNTQQLEKLNQELVTLDSAISELNANMRLGGSPSQALSATPLGGFGNFNSLGFALESMSQIRPENFNTKGMPDATANAIAGALNIAVREAMREFVAPVVGAQGQTTEAVKNLKIGASAQ